ncbi:MAG: NAD-dependent epimerase/dehydratase family protein, partial [Candidatus Nanopelagicales bacterium]
MAIPIPTPEDVPLAVDRVENGRASYALSKVAGEMLVHHGFSDEPDRFISARFHNVYGPRMGSVHVVPELFLRMRGGERPMVISNALATRAFCFVDDAIRAVRHLMDSAPAGVYNVGNDAEEVRIGDLVRRIATVAGYDEANLELDEVSEPPIPRRCPDIRKLRDTGFAPEIDLDEGIRRTLAWYDANDTPRGV